MNVRELIEHLSQFDNELDVMFRHESGFKFYPIEDHAIQIEHIGSDENRSRVTSPALDHVVVIG